MIDTNLPIIEAISVGIFLKNKDKFLLLQRTDTSIWEFPKGHIEKNDDDFGTILREVREETGITEFEIKKYVGSLTFDINKTSFIKRRTIKYYFAETNVYEIILSSEHCNFLWLDKKMVLEHLQFEDIKEIFLKLN